MANHTKGAKKSAAAKRGHKNTTKKKSSAGSRKAAFARWNKGKIGAKKKTTKKRKK